jgi:hypothetical protein
MIGGVLRFFPAALRVALMNDDSDSSACKTSEKSYELCASAANHVTSIST